MQDQNETGSQEPNIGHRERVRRKMLGHMPKGGRCAEIGVFNGDFSGTILEVTKPAELVLIDPWDMLAEGATGKSPRRLERDRLAMVEMYDNVRKLHGRKKKVTIRKGYSEVVLAEYKDDHFDWIYIDGNHQYDFVAADLRLAAQKVKIGGMIAGDDLNWTKDGRMHVREAVLDFLGAAGLPRRVNRLGQQYMIEVTPALRNAVRLAPD